MIYALGPFVFPSKEAAKVRCRAILWSYKPGDTVSYENDDSEVLMHLLEERHPRAKEKIGCGVAAFVVDHDEYRSQCFYIVRTDGSRVDFGMRAIFEPRTLWGAFTKACRDVVEDQILDFLAPRFSGRLWVPCEYSGVLITRDTCRADHVHPDTFAALLNRFLVEQSVDWSSVSLVKVGQKKQIGDTSMLSSWQAFHRLNARLRVVSIPAHKEISRLDRKRKST